MQNSKDTRTNWHVAAVADVFDTLQARDSGLTSAEAAERLNSYGPNELPRKPPPAWWQILIRQFLSPLIYVLLFAAVLSILVGDVTDAFFIAFVLLLNAGIGGYQEWRAEQSTRALQQLLRIQASVLRDEEVHEVDAGELVPGDIVWLESGNRVPADIRLLSSVGLEIDESLLTGESLAVTKDPAWKGEAGAPLGDRHNMAFAGAIVVRGRGKGIVVATGTATSVGQLALDVISTTGGTAPLLVRMERFSHIVAVVVLVASVLIGAIGVFGWRLGVQEMLFFGIALAVSAIPEGLPAALTVALAVASTRMARRRVIVRRLAAVEGLGSCTLIASDKTGTLTQNELTVRQIALPSGERLDVTGEGFAPNGQVLRQGEALEMEVLPELEALTRAAILCNEGDLHLRDETWVWHGDATDLALLSMGVKLGAHRLTILEKYPQVNQIPYEPEQQYAATYHRDHGGVRVFVKGAPERILGMCADQPTEVLATAERMAAEGLRVLAFAEGEATVDHDPSVTPAEPEKLRFLGLAGMIDPLRSGVRDAVQACHSAGIGVCMITGDHPVTAFAISRDLGLANQPDQVVTGRMLDGKDEAHLQSVLQTARVFARVTPRQKLELVNAARKTGHFVAVTGDGVNDAPALRAANIGVAMGKAGTDVARDASDIVLSDDNFASIVAGVEEGRVAYDNVRKVIYLLISCGAAELLALGAAVVMGMPMPLLPVQILWVNVVTNGIQGVALAFEPNEGDVLSRKPRDPGEPIFNRLMVERTVLSAVYMAVVMLGSFSWMLQNGWSEDSARNILLLMLVLFENFHIGNSRSETKSAFAISPLRSRLLLAGTAFALAIHVVAMYTELGQNILKTEAVDLQTWLVLLGVTSSIVAVMELHKLYWAWRSRRA